MKKRPLVVQGIGGIILPSYMGIMINRYRDPASLLNNQCHDGKWDFFYFFAAPVAFFCQIVDFWVHCLLIQTGFFRDVGGGRTPQKTTKTNVLFTKSLNSKGPGTIQKLSGPQEISKKFSNQTSRSFPAKKIRMALNVFLVETTSQKKTPGVPAGR